MKLEARKLRKRKERVKAKLSAKREKLRAERKIQQMVDEINREKLASIVLDRAKLNLE